DRINLEIHRARRTGQRFAVLFIDLDNFKSVNDTLGHAFGDELLSAIGSRLQESLREADTVARLGGDEILILVPDVVGEVEVEKIAERLLQSVSEPRDLNGRKVVIHCSVGIAIYPDNGENVETLMANADNAMYQAKALQEGSAIFFTEEMNVRLRADADGAGPQRRDRARTARAALPADRRHGGPAPSRRGSADPLAPPREGPGSEEHTSELQSHLNLVCR